MHPNNKLYITVESSERQRERPQEVKAIKGAIREVQSIKETRRVGPQTPLQHRPYPLKQRPPTIADSKRDPSPSLSAVSTHEDYFREMETAILSENHNLKQHNNFLKAQIEAMFERQRKFKSQMSSQRDRLRQLQTLNSHLQTQLNLLITSIMSEIERIQSLIEDHRDHDRSLNHHIFEITPKNSEACASETESTIHKDLEDLKAKVKEIYEQKYTTHEPEAPTFHRSEYKSDSSSRFGETRYRDLLPPPQLNYLEMEKRGSRHGQQMEIPVTLVGRPKLQQRGKKPK